ncbi:hypothetical protein [Sulfuricurvum sp. IAE1]|uniref:hypothetical protein n=1 Tax=Sulfuricurvum sp. IAE1 TaxID=2546102 RepID=UPI0014049F4D|nr:hypothetical protein [Sulfuricurvum sp. IAE1]
MEFNSYFNPAVLLLGTMVWIGLFGLYGSYLEKKELKDQSSGQDEQESHNK